MTRVSIVETKNNIIKLLSNEGLFFGLFNVPASKPHRLCVCDDTSMRGNCWGKLVIEGRTWKEVYEVLQTYDLSKAAFATRKLHEVPDNSKPIQQTPCTGVTIMPRMSKSQFAKLVDDQGRVEYTLPRMSEEAWSSLDIDAKNELACDEQVEDGWQLEDIGYSVKKVDGDKVDVTANADASYWNSNEE